MPLQLFVFQYLM